MTQSNEPEQPRPASGWSYMRKHAVVMGLTFLALSAFALFAGWAFFATKNMGNGWADLAPIWPYVAGAVVIVAGLTAFFMWLAFYSANHRYDERIGRDDV